MRHGAKNGDDQELPPSSLRGRLCEVFFSAVLAEQIEALMRRLGDKAELDDPIFGKAAGMGPLRERLIEWTRFLAERDALYDRTITVVGADRDVTEGTLELRDQEQHRSLPIALLMERRREREVALRVFCATSALGVEARGPSASATPVGAVPSFAADLLAAVAKRDAGAATACFEQESIGIRDALGGEHPREAATRVLSRPMTVTGVADNGQTCALEVTFEGGGSRLGLLVLARGDSGLARSLRVYSEI